MEKKDTRSGQPILHTMSPINPAFMSVKLLIIFLVVILLGVGTGYALAGSKRTALPAGQSTDNLSKSQVHVGQTFGSGDTKAFPDSAEGVMQNGGIDGEGQYHLVRPGGDSQNVYLTSSTVDLSLFIGHKVKVNGQTQSAQKAGWLMDVGRVEVEN